MQILYLCMQWKPHSCILNNNNDFWHKVQSMVLKIFICPSHIANWIPGVLESMGRDRHPIRALGVFPLPISDIWNMQIWISFENEQLERPDFDQNIT